MPVYTYKCPECGFKTDVHHGYNDEPEVFCKECGAKMKKVIGNVTFILKGSGWVRKSQSLERDGIPEEVWNNAEKEGLV